MRLRPTGRLLLLSLALLVVSGCGPKIKTFTAGPKSVCESDAFTVDWDVRGDPELSVSLRRADAAAAGVPDTLLFLLTVEKGGDEVTRLEDVLRYPSHFSAELLLDVDGAEGLVLHAADEANPGKWPPNFVIETVSSASGVAITVRHGGTEAELDASGAPSTAFTGLPVLGEWDLEAAVPSLEDAPLTLGLDVTAVCSSGP